MLQNSLVPLGNAARELMENGRRGKIEHSLGLANIRRNDRKKLEETGNYL